MWFWRRFFSFSDLTVSFGLGLGLGLEPLWTRTWLGLEPLWTWTWLGLDLFGLGLVLDSTKVDLTTALCLSAKCLAQHWFFATTSQRSIRSRSLWRNWLARSAVNWKVGGSSPPRDVGFLLLPFRHVSASFRIKHKRDLSTSTQRS